MFQISVVSGSTHTMCNRTRSHAQYANAELRKKKKMNSAAVDAPGDTTKPNQLNNNTSNERHEEKLNKKYFMNNFFSFTSLQQKVDLTRVQQWPCVCVYVVVEMRALREKLICHVRFVFDFLQCNELCSTHCLLGGCCCGLD